MHRNCLFSWIPLIALAIAGRAQTPLVVPNYSFEDPVITEGTVLYDTTPTDWVTFPGYAHRFPTLYRPQNGDLFFGEIDGAQGMISANVQWHGTKLSYPMQEDDLLVLTMRMFRCSLPHRW